jgi:hypothetical protein
MSETARHLIFGGLALLAVFIAAAWDLPRRWLGAPLDLLPPLLVCAALGRRPGGWRLVAVLGGLARDSWSVNPLGASILPLYLTGWFLHARRDLLSRELLFAQLTLGTIASAVIPLFTLGLVMTFGPPPVMGWWLLGQWVALAVTGGLLTPVVFRGMGWLDRWFAHPTVETSAFRPDREILRGRY